MPIRPPVRDRVTGAMILVVSVGPCRPQDFGLRKIDFGKGQEARRDQRTDASRWWGLEGLLALVLAVGARHAGGNSE
jgi:hypothetical protein